MFLYIDYDPNLFIYVTLLQYSLPQIIVGIEVSSLLHLVSIFRLRKEFVAKKTL